MPLSAFAAPVKSWGKYKLLGYCNITETFLFDFFPIYFTSPFLTVNTMSHSISPQSKKKLLL